MDFHTLQQNINYHVGLLYSDVFEVLKVRLKKEGLSEDHIEDFTIFQTIRNDIEKRLTLQLLRTAYHESIEFEDTPMFKPEELEAIKNEICEKYAFLCSDSTEFFARRCSITGALMNEGWLVGDETYVFSEIALCNLLRNISQEPEVDKELTDDELRDKYYEDGTFYFTEWYDPKFISFAKLDGKIYQIDI